MNPVEVWTFHSIESDKLIDGETKFPGKVSNPFSGQTDRLKVSMGFTVNKLIHKQCGEGELATKSTSIQGHPAPSIQNPK